MTTQGAAKRTGIAVPAHDVDVTDALVRTLLKEQHPDLAHLDLSRVTNGWDNVVYRLGQELAVRLPRRASAHQLLLNEVRWLPFLAPRLPSPIPAAVRRGQPGVGYPYHWAVVPWFDGESAAIRSAADRDGYAATLGRFLRALHVPAPADAPRNRVRGLALATRAEDFTRRLAEADPPLEGPWHALFAAGANAPEHHGPPLWLHGDLHPHNLVTVPGSGPARILAVVDFGDITAGDPACDLAAAWLHFTPAGRAAFVAELPYDEDTWLRARGWAVHFGTMMALMPDGDPLQSVGRHAIEQLCREN
ncbi:aminoglycoside phosphotransferase family protein [Arthrobacter sp. AOP36-C1-22]|uniref:aminoglycoside phosphotransferase family protein n=1 Tax=Arthrobacter sp. AOP36-C1-22 TaxID=3457683 RepID=UPI004034C081